MDFRSIFKRRAKPATGAPSSSPTPSTSEAQSDAPDAELTAMVLAGEDLFAGDEALYRAAAAKGDQERMKALARLGANRGNALDAAAANGETTAVMTILADDKIYDFGKYKHATSYDSALAKAIANNRIETAGAIMDDAHSKGIYLSTFGTKYPDSLVMETAKAGHVEMTSLNAAAMLWVWNHGDFEIYERAINLFDAAVSAQQPATAMVTLMNIEEMAADKRRHKFSISSPRRNDGPPVPGTAADKDLSDAAASGDWSKMRTALVHGANPLADNGAPIRAAASAGQTAAVRLMGVLCKDALSPLKKLAEDGDIKGFETVLAAGDFPYEGGSILASIAGGRGTDADKARMARAIMTRQEVPVYQLEEACHAAGATGATETMKLLAGTLVDDWKKRHVNEGFYYKSLKGAFDAAMAGQHKDTAAVALGPLSQYDFPKETPRRYSRYMID